MFIWWNQCSISISTATTMRFRHVFWTGENSCPHFEYVFSNEKNPDENVFSGGLSYGD
jgi:hypothetical protein